MGTVSIAVALLGMVALVEAGIGFPFSCSRLGCAFCPTQRMRQVSPRLFQCAPIK